MSAMFGLASGRLSISPSSSWSYAKSVRHDVHSDQADHPKLALNPTSRSIGRASRSVELITVCRRIYVDALGGSRAARATWQAVDQRAGAPWGRHSASQGVAVPKVASMRRCERRQAPFSARVKLRVLRVSAKPCFSVALPLVGEKPVAQCLLTPQALSTQPGGYRVRP